MNSFKKIYALICIVFCSFSFAKGASTVNHWTTANSSDSYFELLTKPKLGGAIRGVNLNTSKEDVIKIESGTSDFVDNTDYVRYTIHIGSEDDFADLYYYFDESGLYKISIETFLNSDEKANQLMLDANKSYTKSYGEFEITENGENKWNCTDANNSQFNIRIKNISQPEDWGTLFEYVVPEYDQVEEIYDDYSFVGTDFGISGEDYYKTIFKPSLGHVFRDNFFNKLLDKVKADESGFSSDGESDKLYYLTIYLNDDKQEFVNINYYFDEFGLYEMRAETFMKSEEAESRLYDYAYENIKSERTEGGDTWSIWDMTDDASKEKYKFAARRLNYDGDPGVEFVLTCRNHDLTNFTNNDVVDYNYDDFSTTTTPFESNMSGEEYFKLFCSPQSDEVFRGISFDLKTSEIAQIEGDDNLDIDAIYWSTTVNIENEGSEFGNITYDADDNGLYHIVLETYLGSETSEGNFFDYAVSYYTEKYGQPVTGYKDTYITWDGKDNKSGEKFIIAIKRLEYEGDPGTMFHYYIDSRTNSDIIDDYNDAYIDDSYYDDYTDYSLSVIREKSTVDDYFNQAIIPALGGIVRGAGFNDTKGVIKETESKQKTEIVGDYQNEIIAQATYDLEDRTIKSHYYFNDFGLNKIMIEFQYFSNDINAVTYDHILAYYTKLYKNSFTSEDGYTIWNAIDKKSKIHYQIALIFDSKTFALRIEYTKKD